VLWLMVPPLMAGELLDHTQQALPAVRTELTSLEGNIRGARRLALPVRGRGGRHAVRSAETLPAGTRQWTCGGEVRVRGQG
jgi:hypothetical protein